MRPYRLLSLITTVWGAPPGSALIDTHTIIKSPVSSNNNINNITMHQTSRYDHWIECGAGKGVWLLGNDFYNFIDDFCISVEGSDITDGYMVSDTYLVTLSPQGSEIVGKAWQDHL